MLNLKEKNIFKASTLGLTILFLVYLLNFYFLNLEAQIPKLQLDPCLLETPKLLPNLSGPIEVDLTQESLEDVERKLSNKIQLGGRFKTNLNESLDRVAIVIPFRDRAFHLPILLKNLHPMLMKQQIDYGIFLVEQSPEGDWNKGKLMNIGYIEALKFFDWDCFIFHDVDLIPIDDRIIYNCPDRPRHMSAAIDEHQFKTLYPTIFGGVVSIRTEQFKDVNGYSNSYIGWGGEDDDFCERVMKKFKVFNRYPTEIAKYIMLTHKKQNPNPNRSRNLQSWKERSEIDGLTNLKYEILEIKAKPLYTWIYVDGSPESGF